ncbi:MAG: DUF4239 domain-containing protein [Candidatus Melainabacteria bacterium]|jgi:hypothetical protein|nr:DUF4239 domain-containing protein [Candidatus Melainabacteria bacterium]
MGNFLEGFLIIGGSTAASILGMFLVRKNISRSTLESGHEVAGYLLAVIGSLYAILLGLIVVSAQSRLDHASQMCITEANALSDIYHFAHPFDQPARHRIHEAIYNYARVAQKQDWSKVVDKTEEEATTPYYRELWGAIVEYEPQKQSQQACYSSMLSTMQQLSDARRFRMISSRAGLSSVLWMILIVGGVLIVGFTYFFFVENILSQTLMTVFVVFFLSLNIFLIYLDQNPYRPELGIKATNFSFPLKWFKESSAELRLPAALNKQSVEDSNTIHEN